MRVQRAVAVALLSLGTGCGQTFVRQPSQPGYVVAFGLRQPGEAGLPARAGEAEDLALTLGQAGTSLWPEASHPKVDFRADRLSREMEGVLRSGLARSGRYLDIIERELEREGVPTELAYLPIIESNFSHQAVGGGAVGLWQLMAGTARRYGLIVSREIDERRDPEKASRAAAQLLRDLYEQFASWDLALAAYNAGPARVERALTRHPGASFWQLADRSLLPRITREYVPNVLATALIATRPERFGLTDVDRHEPLRYDTYVVSHRLEVATIASLCGSSRAEVAALNPSLKSGVVPRLPSGYQIRLPEGTGQLFAINYAVWGSGRGGETPAASRRS